MRKETFKKWKGNFQKKENRKETFKKRGENSEKKMKKTFKKNRKETLGKK